MKSMYHLNQIPSDAQIRKYLRRILFGQNLFCPVCRSQKVVKYEKRYRCRKCRAKFSLLSHTWLGDMKLSYEKFWCVLWSWTTQIPVKQAQALTGLSEEAVRRWYDRFRTHLPEDHVILEKIVQLDEAYFKKWSLVMGKQPGTRKLAYTMMHGSVQRHHATAFVEQHVKPKSQLNTDGALIYKTINHWWPVLHERDIHAKWEFSKTSEIEGTFGNLRTFIRRMYHHSTPEKLPDYVREFCARFSLPEIFKDPRHYLKKTLSLVPID
jgi:transposase-like protein